MGHILDSREYAEMYSISRTAADAYKFLLGVVYMSRVHGKYRDKDGYYAYIGRATIAQRIGKSESTAARAIAELKAAGLIKTKRTRKYGRVYICEVEAACIRNDTARNTKNDTTNNSNTSINKTIDTSIYPGKMKMADKTADDAKIAVDLARITTATTEKVQDSEQKTVKNGETPKKGKPTAKRRQKITKAEKQAAKEKYRRMLERKLEMANPYWLLSDPDVKEECQRRYSLIDLIAEAMSVKGRQIRVNGAGLSVDQYWYVVQNISEKAIDGLFDRLYTAEAIGGITNKRAYTLAAVYNAVQWDMMTQGADIPTEALYRHMA